MALFSGGENLTGEHAYSPMLEWIDNTKPDSTYRARAHVVRERRRRLSWEEEQYMKALRSKRQPRDEARLVLPPVLERESPNLELLGPEWRDPFSIHLIPMPSHEEQELLDFCK